jgi:hypothetical protein
LLGIPFRLTRSGIFVFGPGTLDQKPAMRAQLYFFPFCSGPSPMKMS